jgi:hypothetical protein
MVPAAWTVPARSRAPLKARAPQPGFARPAGEPVVVTSVPTVRVSRPAMAAAWLCPAAPAAASRRGGPKPLARRVVAGVQESLVPTVAAATRPVGRPVAEARQVAAVHSGPAAVVLAAQQDAVERQQEAAAGAKQVSPPQVAAVPRDELPAVAAVEPGARRAVQAARDGPPGVAQAVPDEPRAAAGARAWLPAEVVERRPAAQPSSSVLQFAPGSAAPVPGPVQSAALLSKCFARSMALRPSTPKPGLRRERRRWRCRPARAI